MDNLVLHLTLSYFNASDTILDIARWEGVLNHFLNMIYVLEERTLLMENVNDS